MRKSIAVIGLGYGDEGKGKVVSCLCEKYKDDNPLVVRYSGGHQSGHRVAMAGKHNELVCSHVFSNFGSGTFQGVPTLWSKNCVVDPVGILNERDNIISSSSDIMFSFPILFVDPKCPVVTPYEKFYNRNDKVNVSHGSCGVGFGQTHQREEDFHSITFSDLYHPSVLKIKLGLLSDYYGFEVDVSDFLLDCEELISMIWIKTADSETIIHDYEVVIFEGSQGLLLDQHIGFFPHVTRSDVGLRGVSEFIDPDEVYYVTRAYQTRHGNGPLTNEEFDNSYIINSEYEMNFDYSFQGKFRKSVLDLSMIIYALDKDLGSDNVNLPKINVIITCTDLITKFKLTDIDGKNYELRTFDGFFGFIEGTLRSFKKMNVMTTNNPFVEYME